jgi:hypothetical protein
MNDAAVFCGNCGKAAGEAAPQPPPFQQQAPPPAFPPQQPYAAPPAKKGPNWLLWIGGGCAVIVLLAVLAVVGTGFFIAKKVKDVGVDSSLMEKNPVLGAARLALAMNPEVEVVKMDESTGELTIREKKTGKVITMHAEDIKNGKISFTDESTGEQVTVGGGEVELPDWVPDYPGSKPQGAVAATGGQSNGGMVHFKTSDDAARVVKFYQEQLGQAGYQVTTPGTTPEGGIVSGQDEANRRNVTVIVGKSEGQTQVSVTYGNKQ